MKLLVIGGTRFVGRHLVQAALAAGHEVTLFSRGISNPHLFPQIERLKGDREGDLAELKGRSWEAVVDTCGYAPDVVAKAAAALKECAGHYIFISTISVYADLSCPGIDEAAPRARLQASGGGGAGSYGPLKALCETAVDNAFSERSVVIRPGLIVGPHDPTDRFTYWPVRISRGGTVLAPGRKERPVQFIDCRDLASFVIKLIEARATGVFNAVGPGSPLTMEEFLLCCKSTIESKASLFWVPDQELLSGGIEPWSDLPLWVPAEHEAAGIGQINNCRAREAGLKFRQLSQTVGDTMAWFSTERKGHRLRAGLTRERERQIISLVSGKSQVV